MIALPPPRRRGEVSVEETLRGRRSARSYAARPLEIVDVAQLAWAAQGITGRAGERTAPSAGALFPLELFLVVGAVTDLPAGVYRYHPREHALTEVVAGDVRRRLAAASCRQSWMGTAPLHLVFAAVFHRTRREYGSDAERYVVMEVGHAVQNAHLQAVALGLGAVVVGAFAEERVQRVVGLAPAEIPVAILPVGRPL